MHLRGGRRARAAVRRGVRRRRLVHGAALGGRRPRRGARRGVPRARAGRPLPRAVPGRRQHGRADRGRAREVNARPAWREAFAGFAFPWFMPPLEVYRPLVEAVGPRDRAARPGAARRRRTRVTRARGLDPDDVDAVHRPPAGGPPAGVDRRGRRAAVPPRQTLPVRYRPSGPRSTSPCVPRPSVERDVRPERAIPGTRANVRAKSRHGPPRTKRATPRSDFAAWHRIAAAVSDRYARGRTRAILGAAAPAGETAAADAASCAGPGRRTRSTAAATSDGQGAGDVGHRGGGQHVAGARVDGAVRRDPERLELAHRPARGVELDGQRDEVEQHDEAYSAMREPIRPSCRRKMPPNSGRYQSWLAICTGRRAPSGTGRTRCPWRAGSRGRPRARRRRSTPPRRLGDGLRQVHRAGRAGRSGRTARPA